MARSPQGILKTERKMLKPLGWMALASMVLLGLTVGFGGLATAPKKAPPRQIVINEAEQLSTSAVGFKRINAAPEGFPAEYLFIVGYEITAKGEFSHPFKVQFLDSDVESRPERPLVVKFTVEWAKLDLLTPPPEGVTAAVEANTAGLFILCEKRVGPPPAHGYIEILNVETGKPVPNLFLKPDTTVATVGETITLRVDGEIDENLRQLWFVGEIIGDPLEEAIGSEFRFYADAAGKHKVTFLGRDPNGHIKLRAQVTLVIS
ncbi:MAG: hypothetical protein L3J82_06170 [Planctomycetes bacterium]|nr:hypothetical protein [Planctomycetota bacterium]